jgi:CSLREA domain-containing protein
MSRSRLARPAAAAAAIAVACGAIAASPPTPDASAVPVVRLSAPAHVAAGAAIPVRVTLDGGDAVRAVQVRVAAAPGAATYAGFRAEAAGRPLGPAGTRSGVAFGAYGCDAAGCTPDGLLARVRLLPRGEGVVEVGLRSVIATDARGNRIPIRVAAPVRVAVGDAGATHRVRPAAARPRATAARVRADVNGDGRVAYDDLATVEAAWQGAQEARRPCGDAAPRTDVDGDGCVTVADAQRVLDRRTARPAAAPARAGGGIRAFASPVSPGPIVVDSTDDVVDAVPGDGICATTADACTLRAAIAEANTHAGPDTIAFAIPGDGTRTIAIAEALPALTDRTGPTTIDGYTQPGATPNTDPVASNARLLVEIRGTAPSVAWSALSILSPGNTVRGLAIYNARPITVSGVNAHGNLIAGNFVGTDATATFGLTTLVRNQSGITIDRGASANTVGGTRPADRNVVAGNAFTGVYLADVGTNDNVVVGNIVGLSPDGRRRVRNQRVGIDVNLGASRTIVGGLDPGERNVVSGNTGSGIEVSHTTATQDNVIEGNYIGTDLAGSAVPSWTHNSEEGVHVEDGVQRTVIRGNVLGDNYFGGVVVAGAVTAGTRIEENWIGVAPDGNRIPNPRYGVGIIVGAHDSVIAGNHIAYNPRGVSIERADSDRNRITRNEIWGNVGLGIDLEPLDVADPNDPGDADAGPNQGQNHPELTAAEPTRVAGATCGGCAVELFLADGAAGDHGEGRTFVASTVAAADGRFELTRLALAEGAVVTATATDAAGNTSEFAPNAVVGAAAPPPVDTAADAFARTVAGGWGAADTGGAWTLGGAAADFSVDGATGRITVSATGAPGLRSAALRSVALAGADAAVTVSSDRLAVGNQLYAWLSLRDAPSGEEYRARLRFAPNGVVYLGIAVANGAAETFPIAETNTGITYAPGTALRLRLQTVGSAPTTVRARVWRAGAPEPAAWQRSVVDATAGVQGAGGVVLGARRSAGESGGPSTISFDDLVAVPAS